MFLVPDPGSYGDPTRVPHLTKAKAVPDVAASIRALRSSDWTTRKRGVIALGKSKSPDAVEPVIACLRDGNPYVRERTVSALVRLGHLAVPALIALLKDDAWYIRQKAAVVIGRIGDPDTFDSLAALLTDRNGKVRLAAASAIAGLKHKKTLRFMLSATRHEDDAIRELALNALGRLGGKTASAQLVASLTDVSERCRTAAAHSLGLLKDSAVADDLLSALKREAGPTAKGAMIRALGCLQAKQAIRTLTTLAKADDGDYGDNWMLGQEAVFALAAIGQPAARSLRHLIVASSDNAASTVVAALRRFNGPWAVDLLSDLAHNPDGQTAYWAIISLGETESPKAIPPLLAAIESGEHLTAAIWSLGNLKTPEADAILRGLLTRTTYAGQRDAIKRALEDRGR